MEKKSIKSIISTGQGRLHLIESAKSLKKQNVDINLITGWIPSKKIPDRIINLLGKILRRNNLAYGLRKRYIPSLDGKIFSCTFSEFFIQFLFFLCNYKFLNRDFAATTGWKVFGKQSKRYIYDSNIFHVRSGAGQGGAIKKAKKNGMKVLVDHSIAHPTEMYNQIFKSFNNHSSVKGFKKMTKFWDLVLKDCYEGDFILVNSQYVKDSFVENGFDSKKIIVAHLGIRKDFWGLKKSYNIDKKIKLLFTGGFGRRKGAEIIVNALEKLTQNNVKFELNVLGTNIMDIDLPDWFLNNKNIILHGHIPQEEMFSFLSSSDIYIFPSYVEGAAQSLKEAMAAGLPVIATRQSGAPIKHKENGMLIKDNSFTELYDKIIDLSENLALRKKIGENAILTIREEHTWERYGETVKRTYEKMVNII